MKISQTLTLLALATVSSTAYSANTIKFQGEVADQTCVVSVNDNPSTPVVLLPTVPVSALDASGKKAGLTNFTIKVSGCTASSESATSIKTVFVGSNLTESGRLYNTGDATNVSLELIDPKSPSIPLDLTGNSGSSGLILAQGEETASYDYAVQYVADGKATPGSVLSNVQYSVSYK